MRVRGFGAWATRLMAEGRLSCTMLFTHAHWDPHPGVSPFSSRCTQTGAEISVFGCPMEQGNMETLLAKTMAPPYFPVPYDRILAKVDYNPVCTADRPTELYGLEGPDHPPEPPQSWAGLQVHGLRAGISSFSRDNELGFDHRGGRSYKEYVEFCAGAELLIHDAEYTEADYMVTRGWGHSTYKDALRLARDAGVKRLRSVSPQSGPARCGAEPHRGGLPPDHRETEFEDGVFCRWGRTWTFSCSSPAMYMPDTGLSLERFVHSSLEKGV